MSQLEVDKIIPQSGTTLTIGDSGDTVTIPSGLTTTGNINFGDNDKALFGTGNDLEIYHSGSASLIKDVGTGNLYLSGDDINITNSNSSVNYLRGIGGNEVKLYHANSEKLATTSTGIDVTGTVVSDGLTVDTSTLHVDSTNNRVGIGTTSPSTNLDISSSGDATINLKASGQSNGLQLSQLTADGGSSISATNNNYLKFSTNATERMRINSSGNVGIGTSSPQAKLDVAGEVQCDALDVDGNSLFTDATGLAINVDLASGPVIAQNFSSADALTIESFGDIILNADSNNNSAKSIIFKESGTEAMRINSAREVSIGTSSPNGSVALTCSDASGDHNIPLDLRTTTSAQDVLRIYANEGGSGGTAIYILPVRTAGTLRGGIYWNGSSLAYNTSSDYRLKENVSYDFDATSRLKQLKPARFNFIADADRTVDGFLAHEVSDIVPEAITGTHNEVDADGNPVYQGIDQAKLVPLLVKTIQELEARIQTLENA